MSEWAVFLAGFVVGGVVIGLALLCWLVWVMSPVREWGESPAPPVQGGGQ